MRRLPSEGDALLVELNRRECALLQEVLRHFPLIPASHHRLSRTLEAPVNPEHQASLAEAMAAQKDDYHTRVQQFLSDPQRFVPAGSKFHLRLTPDEAEWLLQVINDVRVGSWLKLDCPDPDEGRPLNLTAENALYAFLMEFSGYFESELLAMLGSD